MRDKIKLLVESIHIEKAQRLRREWTQIMDTTEDLALEALYDAAVEANLYAAWMSTQYGYSYAHDKVTEAEAALDAFKNRENLEGAEACK